MGAGASKSENSTEPLNVHQAKEAGTPQGAQNVCEPSSVDLDTETDVCEENEIKEGEMQEVMIGDQTALLVKDHGELTAVGATCTHYGAKLSKGVLYNGRVRCPWHGACFNVKTGDIEDFPGLDSLPKYSVEVRSGRVIVKSSSTMQSKKRLKPMSCQSPDNEQVFLIIGGGAASVTCAETLRQEGFKGRLILATKELSLPYDRTKLTKALMSSAEEIALRDANFYEVYDIDVQTNKEAVNVDTMLKCVTFRDGSSINYDALTIATGGSPRKPVCPGADLKNVCLLRTPADANYIAEQGKGKHVAIVGNSFIGMEVAAYLASKAASVSVIGRSSVPLQSVLGQQVGQRLLKLFEEKGVKFFNNDSVKEFIGREGSVREVVLNDGGTLPADMVLVGIGVTPATGFLEGSGVMLNDSGHVIVDKFMKTNKDNIFAAGDIAEFPLFLTGDRKATIGHWQMAQAHGRVAALNMLGQDAEIYSVPYFWTVLFGKSLRYTGYGAGYDEVVLHGDLGELKFVAFYTKGDSVVAVSSLNFDPIVSQAAEVFAAGKTIRKEEISEGPYGFIHKLHPQEMT
ncbi:apoptosis-inducing factor 3 isoform X2 [Lingula anatina]|uniref:Apoptosis-inducing factor 3 isoform X2 n=1 Tax=Lingula anatina TaxID=7574 RepID=A0A1S3H3Q4_LINAN|nr:apoptosis-inducing factor 3 isoform X2 [Lingula anatina]|eukprot:XP_013379769.1 apoptosis-inducing factor 3 isoform X2 [Lingula anatina]